MSDAFNSFKEASNFARNQAINNNEIYSIRRNGNEWVVTSKSKNYQNNSFQTKEPYDELAKNLKEVRSIKSNFTGLEHIKNSTDFALGLENGREKEVAKRESKELVEKQITICKVCQANGDYCFKCGGSGIEEQYIGRGKEVAKRESKELAEKLKNTMGEDLIKARERERRISKNKTPINVQPAPKKVSRFTICKLCQGSGGNCIKCGGSGYEG